MEGSFNSCSIESLSNSDSDDDTASMNKLHDNKLVNLDIDTYLADDSALHHENCYGNNFSNYTDTGSLKNFLSKTNFDIMHINERSLNKNFSQKSV